MLAVFGNEDTEGRIDVIVQRASDLGDRATGGHQGEIPAEDEVTMGFWGRLGTDDEPVENFVVLIGGLQIVVGR